MRSRMEGGGQREGEGEGEEKEWLFGNSLALSLYRHWLFCEDWRKPLRCTYTAWDVSNYMINLGNEI